MTEKELITKIEELRSIEPDKDWAFSLRQRILAEELAKKEKSTFVLFRPIFAGITTIFILCFGAFGLAQNAVPGDALYCIKKFSERGQLLFVSEQEETGFNLALANRRLEELVSIAEENRIKNLSLAIKEAQESISEVSRSLSAGNSDPIEAKRTVDQLEEKVQAVSVLGINFETEGIEQLRDSTNKNYAESLVASLNEASLTENQENVLREMESLMEEQDYLGAIEVYNLKFNITEEEMEEETEIEEEESEE